MGLLGEVVTNISAELLEMLSGVQQRREQEVQDTGTEPGSCAGLSYRCIERKNKFRWFQNKTSTQILQIVCEPLRGFVGGHPPTGWGE